jgi:hypothetical protein
MKSTNLACAAVAAVFVSVAAATPALALPDTYVTATGSNANNCAITTPCQTMAFGVSHTDAGGVLHCLDNNNYFNGATITQSITIDCSNTTADGGAFIINGSGISVHIRGLSMRQVGTGVVFENGAALYVENCLIYGNTNGIVFEPSAAASLFIVNSTIRNNGAGGVEAGIDIKPASGIQAIVTIDHSRIENNIFGIVADGNSGGIINGVSEIVSSLTILKTALRRAPLARTSCCSSTRARWRVTFTA